MYSPINFILSKHSLLMKWSPIIAQLDKPPSYLLNFRLVSILGLVCYVNLFKSAFWGFTKSSVRFLVLHMLLCISWKSIKLVKFKGTLTYRRKTTVFYLFRHPSLKPPFSLSFENTSTYSTQVAESWNTPRRFHFRKTLFETCMFKRIGNGNTPHVQHRKSDRQTSRASEVR